MTIWSTVSRRKNASGARRTAATEWNGFSPPEAQPARVVTFASQKPLKNKGKKPFSQSSRRTAARGESGRRSVFREFARSMKSRRAFFSGERRSATRSASSGGDSKRRASRRSRCRRGGRAARRTDRIRIEKNFLSAVMRRGQASFDLKNRNDGIDSGKVGAATGFLAVCADAVEDVDQSQDVAGLRRAGSIDVGRPDRSGRYAVERVNQ